MEIKGFIVLVKKFVYLSLEVVSHFLLFWS